MDVLMLKTRVDAWIAKLEDDAGLGRAKTALSAKNWAARRRMRRRWSCWPRTPTIISVPAMRQRDHGLPGVF